MPRGGYTGGLPVGQHYQVTRERRRNWWQWTKNGRTSKEHWFERPLPFTGATAVCGASVPQGCDEMECSAKPRDPCANCERIYTESLKPEPVGSGLEALGRLLDTVNSRPKLHYTIGHRIGVRGNDFPDH